MGQQQDSNASAQTSVTELFGDEFASPEIEKPADTGEGQGDGKREDVVDRKQTATNDDATKFRREIDLGDGSGKQVFEADSAEELIDKLTTAQENATRKIREQQFELRRAARAKPEKEV